ncbi:alpha/beta fold hydrolase [Streptomyces sp. NPDC060243]|uniref:alpha/beta fold hydrolase n=1 Tax=Streptomyces sp. NPDC060243 TaxID=3347081 RepID=UPI0036568A50
MAEPVAHLDWGGDGPPVLLLHGLAGYAGEWEPVAVRLRERGHRVLAMDLRGHGGSVRHPRDTNANAHADDVAGLLGRLGAGPAVLVGQSLGGRVALRVAVEHPSLVRGLALVEADARPASGAPNDAAIRWLRSWPLPFPDRASAAAWLGGGAVGDAWAGGLEERDGGLRPRFDVDVLARLFDALLRAPSWPAWTAPGLPVLLLVAEHGILAPAAVRAMLAARPDAWSLGVPGAGHDVHLERPDAVAGFLDAFLAARL